MNHDVKCAAYHSIPGKRPPHGKRPGGHFRGMNGECPLPGKRPVVFSTVRNGKRLGHVSILYQFFTSFFGPSKIIAQKFFSFEGFYAIHDRIRRPLWCALYGMYANRQLRNVACTHLHVQYNIIIAVTLTPTTSIFTCGKRPVR